MIKTSSRERLTKSALISAALHLAAIAVLFSKPLYLNPRFFSSIGKTPTIFLEEENITTFKRNQALDEALSYFETLPPLPPMSSGVPMSQSKTVSMKEIELGFEMLPMLPPIALSLPAFANEPFPAFPTPAFAEDTAFLIQPPSISRVKPVLIDPSIDPSAVVLNYSVPAPAIAECSGAPASFDFTPSEEPSRALVLASPEIPSPENVDNMTPLLGAPSFCEVPCDPGEPILAAHTDFSISPATPRSIIGIRAASSLGEYGLPALELKEWNEFFDVDVKTYAKEEANEEAKEKGRFLFSIHITPKVDLSEYRLKQNYLFVIDRSNSLDKHRYQTAKKAAFRAITALRPGDSFNILILDGAVTKLNESPIPFNKANLGRAEVFLEKQSQGHHGAATDIYTTLTKILSSEIETQEAVTAILISDGDSPLKSGEQRKRINHWLEANRDRMTLYTATAGHGNNLSSLKMLSLASRGSLLYSDTHAAFPRRLAKFVMDLRNPIAKEMTASIISSEDSRSIELLPPSSRLPNLFSDHPYVLIGQATALTDFTLLLEGKNKDQIFKIKKTICLSKARQGSRLLLKQWSAEKAHTLFDQYLREGESTLLKQAEKQLDHDTQNSRR